MSGINEDSPKKFEKCTGGLRSYSSTFQESAGSWAQNRMITDFKEIKNDSMLNIEADLCEDCIFLWYIKFPAPNGKSVKATLHFDSQYPFVPPRMVIKQRLFHPNISRSGEVCLQDLKNIWTPAHCIWSLILSVQSVLSDPNANDPVNCIAANMLLHTPETYHEYASECFEMLDFSGKDSNMSLKSDKFSQLPFNLLPSLPVLNFRERYYNNAIEEPVD